MKPTIQQQQELQRQQRLESEVITMKPTIQQQQELQKQAMVKKEQDDYSSMIQEINNSTQDIDSIVSDEEEPVSEENEDAAVAARRLIRSASRKSRTRSTLITDEAAQAMIAMIASTTPSPSEPMTVKKYATLRNHNMEIDTASIRRANSNTDSSSLDIQKWSTNDASLSPSPKRAIMSSTMSGSATVSGKKMAKQQQLNTFNNSTDDLLKSDTKSATLGRKKSSETTTSGPKSLRNLFTRPSADDKSSMISVPSITSKEQSKESQLQYEEEEEEEEKEENVKSAVPSMIDTDTPTPQSPITSAEPSPYSSKNNTLRKMGNNVDTIRRMLQSSWSGNNLKESGSSNSLSSSDYMGSVGSSYRPVASPLGSVNPRMQNQHLVSLSLKANASQQARNRPSMPVGFMNEEEGPMPTASFSSSTVRTMIPADEEEVDRSRIKPKTSVMGNILGSRQPRQPSKLGDRKAPIKKQPVGKKTPAQIEREKYLKSLET
ncbi:hypothetical protein BDF21DRAFT_434233 [Thamnidium elegans]|nr:hypothetical protein BDF21DRAFT_434233 [Thamnidium elegans]